MTIEINLCELSQTTLLAIAGDILSNPETEQYDAAADALWCAGRHAQATTLRVAVGNARDAVTSQKKAMSADTRQTQSEADEKASPFFDCIEIGPEEEVMQEHQVHADAIEALNKACATRARVAAEIASSLR